MKIKNLVLLLVGLFLLTVTAGCDMEYLEDMVNEIYQDEESLDKDSNNSVGNSSGNTNPPAEPPVGEQSPEEDKPTSSPETPEEIPPVETPPSQVPGEGQPTPKPPVSPEQPQAKPDVPVAPEWTMPQTTVSGTTVIKNITASAADLATTKISAQVPNDGNIYFAIKLEGESPRGSFYQAEKTGLFKTPEAYPRGYEFTFRTDENGKVFFVRGAVNTTPGYRDEYGFSNSTGTKMETLYYVGDSRFKVPLQSSGSSKFSFANFVMTDYKVEGFGGSYSRPYFCRLNSSNPLTIDIPVEKYNPDIHKNVARVTVFFEPDRNKTANYYTVIFDGFEPK